jgi:hypothetical protein
MGRRLAEGFDSVLAKKSSLGRNAISFAPVRFSYLVLKQNGGAKVGVIPLTFLIFVP